MPYLPLKSSDVPCYKGALLLQYRAILDTLSDVSKDLRRQQQQQNPGHKMRVHHLSHSGKDVNMKTILLIRPIGQKITIYRIWYISVFPR